MKDLEKIINSLKKFTVILVGGASGVGKSTFVNDLGKKLQRSVLEVDDIRLAMQSISKSDSVINTFTKRQVFLEHSAQKLSSIHGAVSLETCKGLVPIIENHLARDAKIILEGDDILPEFFDQKFDNGKVVALFLTVADVDTHKQRIISRAESLGHKVDKEYLGYIDLAIRDNERIISDARRCGFEVFFV